MRRPHIPGPTTLATTMPPRCLDVWIPFLPRWLKTPLLSQQRSQSCIFSGAWALFEIVHGDLSVRATAQKCLLSHFFPFSPPRPVGGVSIRHYLSWCGWRTLKIHPLDHTLQIHKYKYTPPLVHYKFRAEGNLSHPAE